MPMRPKFVKPPRTWRAKFRDAFRGLGQAVYQQNSYMVHFFFAALVLLGAFFFQFDVLRWGLLILTITFVITTEILNTSLEVLAQEVTEEESDLIRKALDISSGAVLFAAFGAIVIGFFLFGPPLLKMIVW